MVTRDFACTFWGDDVLETPSGAPFNGGLYFRPGRAPELPWRPAKLAGRNALHMRDAVNHTEGLGAFPGSSLSNALSRSAM